MSDIDIESPGADTAALKAALGALLGMELLSTGSISSPVPYLDVALPGLYPAYKLMLLNFSGSASSLQLSFGVSPDGGTTFHNEETDYICSYIHGSNDVGQFSNAPGHSVFADGLAYFADSIGAGAFLNTEALIQPGDAGSPFYLQDFAGTRTTGDMATGTFAQYISSAWLAENGRQNLIRIAPYGNGDINPPTGTDTLISGRHILWGILP